MEYDELDLFLKNYKKVEETLLPLVDVSTLVSPERTVSGKAETLGKLSDELKKYFGAWKLAYDGVVKGEEGMAASYEQLLIDSLNPYEDTSRVYDAWLCIAAKDVFMNKVKEHFKLKEKDKIVVCLDWFVVKIIDE